MKLSILTSIAALLMGASATSYCPAQPATPEEQSAIFDEYCQKFYVDKNITAAFLDHVAEDYIQHNPNVLSGRQNAIDFLSSFFAAANHTILRKAFADDIGYAHTRVDATNKYPEAIADFVRFDGTCIVEHWDVKQTKFPNATNPLAFW